MNTNPIYIVGDDKDDEDLVEEAIRELGYQNELKFFHSGDEILNELKSNDTVPFIILSDINLPRIDGFKLREKILTESPIANKSVPFIFWSTTASNAQVKKAYDLSAQGFFLKGASFNHLKEELDEIIKYWSNALTPRE
ncbi:MAG: response regulator [Chitinophagaceae bacterium]|nr:response regulator [Chitinophagaceae bacterium]